MGLSLLPKASCSGFLLGDISGFSEMGLFLFDGVPEEDVLASGVLKEILAIWRQQISHIPLSVVKFLIECLKTLVGTCFNRHLVFSL